MLYDAPEADLTAPALQTDLLAGELPEGGEGTLPIGDEGIFQ